MKGSEIQRAQAVDVLLRRGDPTQGDTSPLTPAERAAKATGELVGVLLGIVARDPALALTASPVTVERRWHNEVVVTVHACYGDGRDVQLSGDLNPEADRVTGFEREWDPETGDYTTWRGCDRIEQAWRSR